MIELPSRVKNITGQKFSKLTVLNFAYIKNHKAHWLCKCDCGKEKIINNNSLQQKHTQSCGCNYIKHGYAFNNNRHPLYNIWLAMKQRCYNQKELFYKNYGERGITVCNKWITNPAHFIQWGLDHG